MRFLVLLLVMLSASRAGAQEFVCGLSLASDSEGIQGTGAIVDRSSSTTQDDAY